MAGFRHGSNSASGSLIVPSRRGITGRSGSRSTRPRVKTKECKMNVISRLCAGIVLAVSLTGCHCLQNSCAPYGGGYCGPAPTECGGCGTNCTGYGGGGFGVPLLGCNAFACAAPPVNPCPDPCVTPSRTGCCLLDGIGHILDSIHFGCGNYYSQPWVGYGNCGYNNCGS